MSSRTEKLQSIKSAYINAFPHSDWGDNGSVKVVNSFKEEYNSLRRGVAIRNISDHTVLKLTGKDVLDFLHRISTNRVKDLPLFHHKRTLFTNEKGRFIDRTTLIRFGEHFLLIGSPDSNGKLQHWIEKYIIMEDIQVEDVTGNFAIMEAIGPQSDSFMTLMCGKKIDDIKQNNLITGDTDGVKTYITKVTEIRNINKYWIISPSEETEQLITYIKENKSVFNLNFIGENAYEVFRVENGLPKFPNELNDDYNPHEIGLIDEIDFTKGCYIGQEVIARLDTYDKVQRNLTGVIFDKDEKLQMPAKISTNEIDDAGEITSFVHSELLGINIGLALLRKKAITDSKNIYTESESGDKLKITISKLPFEK